MKAGKPLQVVAPARFERRRNATAAAKLKALEAGSSHHAGTSHAVRIAPMDLLATYAPFAPANFARKRCAMMAVRESKLDFALPDAALPPILPIKNFAPSDFRCAPVCTREPMRVVASSERANHRRRREHVTRGVE